MRCYLFFLGDMSVNHEHLIDQGVVAIMRRSLSEEAGSFYVRLQRVL